MKKLFWLGIILTLFVFFLNIYIPLVHPYAIEEGLDTIFLVFPMALSTIAFYKERNKNYVKK